MAGSAAGLKWQPHGPRTPRAVALCVALALVGHAALLACAVRGGAAGHESRLNSERLLRVTLTRPAQDVTPPPPSDDKHGSEALVQADTTASSDARSTAERPPSEAAPPALLEPPPELGLPDAALPDAGVQVRIHLRVGSDGQTRDIATALWPADAPRAFAKLGAQAAAVARFAPSDAADRSYCLQLEFKAELTAPTWSWRPDAGERCLTNPRIDGGQPLPALR